jgi:mono/diheme cytochrome c family protein
MSVLSWVLDGLKWFWQSGTVLAVPPLLISLVAGLYLFRHRHEGLTSGRMVVPWLLFLLPAALVGYLSLAPIYEIGGVSAPAATHVRVARLNQGWSVKESRREHHTSQGTRILPLAWFLALEQPVLTPLPVGRFADRRYLSRFGFLYDDDKVPSDGLDLPIGFAIEEQFFAPYAKPPVREPTQIVGLTCAACHTGRLDVAMADGTTTGVLIEGGSATINLSLFQEATGRALVYTTLMGPRFNRFARRVLDLPLADGDPRKESLRKEVQDYISTGLASQNYARDHKLVPVAAGFSRTDALGLIGNRVFGVMSEENQVVTDAPVNFPHLWDTPWFDWVQYNASIRTPMARNIGEALGVGAVVNLTDNDSPPYTSSVNVPNLGWIEDLLGGDEPFKGLQPPRWDDFLKALFGAPERAPKAFTINRALASQGEQLYLTLCSNCHMPPRDELRKDLTSKSGIWFTEPEPAAAGKRFFRMPVIDLNVIGTDPNQALNFHRRVAVSPFPKAIDLTGFNWSETISAEDGLFRITSFVRRRAYQGDSLKLLAPDSMTGSLARQAFDNDPDRKAARLKLDRFRTVAPALDVGDQTAIETGVGQRAVIVANLGYKARPLDGIWATPPYFHNGSVPNLYQVLLPVERRAKSFSLGTRRFDPVNVGYETEAFTGSFELDTSLRGNRSTGHEFRNLTIEELEADLGVSPDGTLDLEDRWAYVLGGLTRPQLTAMSPDQRDAALRKAGAAALSRHPIKGVLGVELREEERRQLVEYLKTL